MTERLNQPPAHSKMGYSTSAAPLRGFNRSTPEMVASLLRTLRRDAGLRQQDLAALLHRSQSYISKYENCKRRLDITELLAIREALGVTFAVFASLLDEEMRA